MKVNPDLLFSNLGEMKYIDRFSLIDDKKKNTKFKNNTLCVLSFFELVRQVMCTNQNDNSNTQTLEKMLYGYTSNKVNRLK